MTEFDILDLTTDGRITTLTAEVARLTKELNDAHAAVAYKNRVHADAIRMLESIGNDPKGTAP